jgi:hypothetical protein
VTELANELRGLDEVEQTSAPQERSLGAVLMVVEVAGGVLSTVSTGVPVVQKLVEMIRGRGAQRAKIELPNGTTIAVDSASVEDVERLVRAAASG